MQDEDLIVLDEEIIQLFKFDHLKEGILRSTSEKFSVLAHDIVSYALPSFQRTMMLQNLLVAKDCAVRAVLKQSN